MASIGGVRFGRIVAVPLLYSQLACCFSCPPNPGYTSSYSSSDAISDATAVLNMATLGLGAASVINNANSSAGAVRSAGVATAAAGSTYRAPTSNGYSQVGAFRECATLYHGVDAQREAICRQNASNMSSLR